MKLKIQTIILGYILILLTACGTKGGHQETDEQKTATNSGETSVADSLMAQAMAAADAERMLALADSLEATGDFSPTAANYYRGGAYSILQKVVLADSCLRKATDNTNPTQKGRFFLCTFFEKKI